MGYNSIPELLRHLYTKRRIKSKKKRIRKKHNYYFAKDVEANDATQSRPCETCHKEMFCTDSDICEKGAE